MKTVHLLLENAEILQSPESLSTVWEFFCGLNDYKKDGTGTTVWLKIVRAASKRDNWDLVNKMVQWILEENTELLTKSAAQALLRLLAKGGQTDQACWVFHGLFLLEMQSHSGASSSYDFTLQMADCYHLLLALASDSAKVDLVPQMWTYLKHFCEPHHQRWLSSMALLFCKLQLWEEMGAQLTSMLLHSPAKTVNTTLKAAARTGAPIMEMLEKLVAEGKFDKEHLASLQPEQDTEEDKAPS
eukprot:TRINITY_DN63057_c0_g1_i2.p1 TRINITY_DN63057_c0_g1~~TRINITY_DN63057_c0_g1_i2.p1  ORF type:complete len:285 (+),score=31.45 TRINITY_DN63057_c0_g1_i2:127-855(+)